MCRWMAWLGQPVLIEELRPFEPRPAPVSVSVPDLASAADA